VKKTMFVTIAALGATAFLLMAQDASKFNGTWKGEQGGQTRNLTLKDGVVFMEETQPNGRVILRQYPTNGQEVAMTEAPWKDSKATGKMAGNKLVVDTTMPNGTKWHDEWTLAEDGKTDLFGIAAECLGRQRHCAEGWRGRSGNVQES
jgi:hypothetical protein